MNYHSEESGASHKLLVELQEKPVCVVWYPSSPSSSSAPPAALSVVSPVACPSQGPHVGPTLHTVVSHACTPVLVPAA